MRIVFMGTPDFAVGTLQALVESGKHEIAAVVTQPDRPKGRGQKMLMTPVKEYALSQGLPVYQPAKVKTPEVIAQLRELRPEIIVVAAFGQLLNQELLALPPLGCVNVHASLLPKYRGAAPIHYAILQGEKESGVTFKIPMHRVFVSERKIVFIRNFLLTSNSLAVNQSQCLVTCSGICSASTTHS